MDSLRYNAVLPQPFLGLMACAMVRKSVETHQKEKPSKLSAAGLSVVFFLFLHFHQQPEKAARIDVT
jgi:hypothetical protein